MARATIRTDETRSKFMEALAEGMSIANAAGAAGTSRAAVYLWRKDDPLFAQDWDDAVEVGTDKLEDEARRAMNGSDAVLMFLLKARRPAQYKDKSLHEHVGPSGGPVQIENFAGAREEFLAKIKDALARQQACEEADAKRGLQ